MSFEHLLSQDKYTIDSLLEIMAILRSENGCPWDREQDHHTIRNDFIEETYEAIEAIDSDDAVHLRPDIDERLLGGFVVHIGGVAYDASLRARLEELREHMMEDEQ